MELRMISEPIKFGLKINTKNQRVIVNYPEFDEFEEFDDFYSFLESFSDYYRNRIDTSYSLDEKLALCNSCYDTLISYKHDLRGILLENKMFNTEIQLKLDLFNHWKMRIQENKLLTSKSKNNSRQVLETRSRILLMEYLGCIDLIKELPLNTDKNKYQILSDVLNADLDNTTKWARNLQKVAEKGGNTKTRKSLEFIKEYFQNLKLYELVSKVKEDIDRIK